MRKPVGLKLRGGRWHISKTVRVGAARKLLQEATGLREEQIDQATEILDRRIAEARQELLNACATQERSFRQAAVEYVLSLERRSKDPARAIQDLDLLDPWIGDLPLSHVHQQALVPFEHAMRTTGRHSGTVGRAIRTAVAVLNLAARVLRDGNRPWLIHAVPKIVPPDWGDTRQPYRLTWEEQDRLLAASSPHLVPVILFAVNTGARQHEITTLRWEWEAAAPGLPKGAAWWIPPAIRKGSARSRTSDQEGRYLVANRTARNVIDAQRANGSPLVFPGPAGQEVLRWNNTGWRTALRNAGLSLRFHDLRHTYGERLGAARVPWEHRQVLLGHRIREITAHYSPAGLLELVDMADRVTRETAPVLRPVVGRVG